MASIISNTSINIMAIGISNTNTSSSILNSTDSSGYFITPNLTIALTARPLMTASESNNIKSTNDNNNSNTTKNSILNSTGNNSNVIKYQNLH